VNISNDENSQSQGNRMIVKPIKFKARKREARRLKNINNNANGSSNNTNANGDSNGNGANASNNNTNADANNGNSQSNSTTTTTLPRHPRSDFHETFLIGIKRVTLWLFKYPHAKDIQVRKDFFCLAIDLQKPHDEEFDEFK
jgi:hypothetical protein